MPSKHSTIPRESRATRFAPIAAAVVVTLSVAACSGGSSVYTSRPMDPEQTQQGLHYALPLRMVTLNVDESSIITMTGYASVPDPQHHYILRYNSDSMSSDSLTIASTAEGFLTTVNTEVTDETPSIIVKLVDAIARVAVGIPPSAEARTVGKKKPFAMSIDPTDEKDRASFANALIVYGHDPVTLNCTMMSVPLSPCPTPCGCDPCGKNGVFYRPLLLYRLTFQQAGTEVGMMPILLTQGAPLLCYDVTRGTFIKKKVDLTFDKGLLTGVVINKPSEIAGLIDIPIEIARTILSLPAELLTFKVNHVTNETNYLRSLTALIEAQNALRAAESAPTGGANAGR